MTGDTNSYGRKGILSAPIYMDNVACYGSEGKLMDCSYNTDATKEDHLNHIWIQCDTTPRVVEESSNEKPNCTTSVAALAIALIALGISILVIVFLIGSILCRHKCKTHTTDKYV